MEILQILERAVKEEISDIFVVAGLPLTFKKNGRQERLTEFGVLSAEKTAEFIKTIYDISGRAFVYGQSNTIDDDFSLPVSGLGRFRVNVFHQRGSLAAVIRVIKFGMPNPQEFGIPQEVLKTAEYKNGIVLVTGQAGSGKSTTLACIIDAINHKREGHILTLEDPIEFVHNHDKCIVSQREIYSDCADYISALKSALRESPDVILLGEMRDSETIEVAMTAAETGQLLFSSLHTLGAANTIDRVVDSFPAGQQQQIRLQLSMVLQSVISQQLLPGVDGKLVPAFEIMHVNSAVRNLIRECKTHQLDSVILAGSQSGMKAMDASILELYRQGKITKETALMYCMNEDAMYRKL